MQQVWSQEFTLICVFFLCNVLQCQFTIGNIGIQFEQSAGDASDDLIRFFNGAFASSFVFTPVMGHVIDKLGIPWALTLINSLLLGALACLLSTWRPLQYVACIMYSMGRVSLWASFFAFLGATFGFVHFGKLAGFGLLLGGCLSLLQYPLLAITLGPLEGDFTFVNLLFIASTTLMYAVILALSWRLARSSARAVGKSDCVDVEPFDESTVVKEAHL